MKIKMNCVSSQCFFLILVVVLALFILQRVHLLVILIYPRNNRDKTKRRVRLGLSITRLFE